MQEVPMPGGGVPPGSREGANDQIAQLKHKNTQKKTGNSEWRSKKTYLFVGVLVVIVVALALILL